MRITSKHKNSILFEQLQFGDVFKKSDMRSYFMKISSPNPCGYNAVNLEHGNLANFQNVESVILMDAEMTVAEAEV